MARRPGPRESGQGLEPGLAVGVVKGLPRGHLLDVRRRMHIVPIPKRQAGALRQQLPDRGLTGARDSLDHHVLAHHPSLQHSTKSYALRSA